MIQDHISNFYQIPISCKIMTFMIAKNVLKGAMLGIRDFTTVKKPVTNLFEYILSHAMGGVLDAVLWPYTFPTFILSSMDDVVNFFLKH